MSIRVRRRSSRGDRDHNELLRLVFEYAHGVDRRDVEQVTACFAQDARFESRRQDGSLILEGRAAIGRYMRELFAGDHGLLGPDVTSTHMMSNTVMDIQRSDAVVDTASVIYLVGRGDRILVRGVSYRDGCEVRDGRWQIVNRLHVLPWSGAMSATDEPLGTAPKNPGAQQ